ncbi:MAG: hypothetical protein ACTSU7_13120 [Candidatus Heimdallarchaeaceae archaeon]
MSHFTEVKINVSNRDYIKKALDRMSLTYEEGDNLQVRAAGTTGRVDLKLADKFGLAEQKDSTWQTIGDTYRANNKDIAAFYGARPGFERVLATNYTIEETTAELEAQNFYLNENEDAQVGEDGLITMIYESY